MSSCWAFASKLDLSISSFLCFDLDGSLKPTKCSNKRGWNNPLLLKRSMNGSTYHRLFVTAFRKFLPDSKLSTVNPSPAFSNICKILLKLCVCYYLHYVVMEVDALIKTLNASFLNFSLPGTSEDIMQLSSLFGCKVNLMHYFSQTQCRHNTIKLIVFWAPNFYSTYGIWQLFWEGEKRVKSNFPLLRSS